ncbi:MAG: porin family protein [Bacteroidota bacterium]|nr:porin family protein [Bacteroidota bacterium]
MKKLLIILTVMFISSSIMAQLSFGPKLGYTSSELTTESSEINDDMKSSLHFGAFVRLGTKFYIQPEVLWMTKGAKFKYEILNGASQDIKLNTIDIPLLVGMKVIDLKLANIRVMGGPVASFVTKKDIDNTGALQDALTDNDIKDANWAFQLGAGVDALMFTLDVRYEIGLTDIYDGNLPAEFDISDIKNNSFLVTLGWKIF